MESANVYHCSESQVSQHWSFFLNDKNWYIALKPLHDPFNWHLSLTFYLFPEFQISPMSTLEELSTTHDTGYIHQFLRGGDQTGTAKCRIPVVYQGC
jgi:hypothetical protein